MFTKGQGRESCAVELAFGGNIVLN
jgi:hypothetical protein